MSAKLSAFESFRYRYRAWKYRWKTEVAEIDLVRQLLKPGQTALDIGGHKGAFTYWMQRSVGRDGRVITFEPQPELADYLRRVRDTLRYEHVEVLELALSSRSGQATLGRDTSGPSPGASLDVSDARKTHQFTVQVETLDAVLARREVDRVDFIKCDAEGHELEVFRGGAELLSRQRPPILFECEQRHCSDHDIGDVFRLLEEFGYEGQFIQRRKLHPLSAFQAQTTDPSDPDYVYNFLFRARDAAGQQGRRAA